MRILPKIRCHWKSSLKPTIYAKPELYVFQKIRFFFWKMFNIPIDLSCIGIGTNESPFIYHYELFIIFDHAWLQAWVQIANQVKHICLKLESDLNVLIASCRFHSNIKFSVSNRRKFSNILWENTGITYDHLQKP